MADPLAELNKPDLTNTFVRAAMTQSERDASIYGIRLIQTLLRKVAADFRALGGWRNTKIAQAYEARAASYDLPETTARVPGPPTNVTAVAGDTKATVSWVPPADRGSSPITGYTATSSPGALTATAGPSATSVDVTGLSNGTAYTFTVKATNAVGSSVASAASNSVTPSSGPTTRVPGAPTAVTATAGDASVTVTWTAPADAGTSPITSYTVTGSGSAGSRTATATARTLTFTGLTNGTAYTFTVKATNAVGDGPASSPPVSATPTATTRVPGVPTQLVATAGDRQIVLSWVAPSDKGSPATLTNYRVTVTSAGGNWTQLVPAAQTSYTFTALTNGMAYTFTVAAQNATGLSAESASVSKAPVGAASVWTVSYWNNITFTGSAVLTRGQDTLDLNTQASPGPNVNATNWCMRGTAVVNIPTAGDYLFTVTTDDGARLYVDSNLKIDAWIDQAATTYTATVTLTAGNHNLAVEFYQATGAAVFSLSWTLQGGGGGPGTRDPRYWPYRADSPWNTPLGSGATYSADASAVAMRNPGVNWVGEPNYSAPIFLVGVDPGATSQVIHWASGGTSTTLIPSNTFGASGSDSNFIVIETDYSYWDVYGASKVSGGWNSTGNQVGNPLNCKTQYGFPHSSLDGGAGEGCTAGGTPWLAGMIRIQDILNGYIGHAIAMGTGDTAGRSAYRWPMIRGEKPEGSQVVSCGDWVAIPASVNLATLGLSTDGMVLAKAFQDFGGIVRDFSGGPIIYAETRFRENSTAQSKMQNAINDIPKWGGLLQRVTNIGNGLPPAGQGMGGGTPRAPLAPGWV